MPATPGIPPDYPLGPRSYEGGREPLLLPCLIACFLGCVVLALAAALVGNCLSSATRCAAAGETPAPANVAGEPTSESAWVTIVSETFDQNDLHWPASASKSDSGSVEWKLEDGVYIFEGHFAKDVTYYVAPTMDVISDFSVSVETRRVDGGSQHARPGIIVCLNGADFYEFDIDDGGDASLYAHSGKEWIELWSGASDAIVPGVNTLMVERHGRAMTLSVNGDVLTTVSDPKLPSGRAGVAAAAEPDSDVRIAFDNFTVRVPSQSLTRPAATRVAAQAAASATTQAVEAAAAAHAQWTAAISETFTSNFLYWIVGDQNSTRGTIKRSIADDQYHWEVQTPQGVFWSAIPSAPAQLDFSVAASVRQISGPEGARAGIVFRNDGRNYYVFEVNGRQQYSVYLFNDGEWKALLSNKSSGQIRLGEANRLQVDAEGGHFTFFINGRYVADLYDDAIGSGKVGLGMDMPANGTGVVDFDDFVLRVAPDNAAHATATAQAARAIASVTAVPASTLAAAETNAAATSQPARAAATAAAKRAYIMPAGWQTTLTDTFSANTRGWPLDDTAAGFGPMTATLGGGTLRWHGRAESDALWVIRSPYAVRGDFALEFAVRLPASPSKGKTGVAIGQDGSNNLVFLVGRDQIYSVVKYRDGARMTRASGYTGSLLTGASNRLMVVAQGTSYAFYVNNDFVARVDDATATMSHPGFAMSLPAGEETDFAFEAFELWEP